jgi:putative Mg2+ transporter-C (MgtC) family protein
LEDILLRLGLPQEWIEILRLGLLGRLVLAATLGGLIGLEREISGKPAGLRTNLLICMGAALLMELSINIAALVEPAYATGEVALRSDPARIAAQIVSGIGFLGAGSILQSRGSVTGLTTAATIWVVAAIGMAVGGRFYVEAIGASALVGFSLVLLRKVEMVLIRRRRTQRYMVVLDPDAELLNFITETFRRLGLQVETESVEKGAEQFEAAFDVAGPAPLHPRALEELVEHAGIRKVTRIL